MSLALVILGSGLAGYTVAREFRKLDKHTPLVVVSRDSAGFYSKPMLSNALAGKKTAAALVMKPADKMAAELDAVVKARTRVLRIDTAARQVVLDSGEVIDYRDLVLAVGADPIRLPLQGDAAGEVLSVNDLDDYAVFAQRLEGAKTVAILGAGLIGCEFANDLLARDIRPVLIDLADRALPRLLPPEASARLQSSFEAAGVRFHFGTAAARVDRHETGLRVTLTNGQTVDADLVLSAIGLKPRTQLALEAGLTVNRGVVVDRLLKTSAPHVYAVGDCTEVEGHTLPFVMPLMQQGRALGATLAGTPTPVTYPAMPVIVKTPACPTAVCPPPMNAAGEWVSEVTDDGCVSLFNAGDGTLLGFAVMGAATSQRQALAARIKAWLG